jgi:transcriptional regulator with XRE-family HTH domain
MPSDLGRKFTLTEVDRSRLKLAREAQDFSHKQLAAKLCLSHSYIAQLEENQLTVFLRMSTRCRLPQKWELP